MSDKGKLHVLDTMYKMYMQTYMISSQSKVLHDTAPADGLEVYTTNPSYESKMSFVALIKESVSSL